MVKGVFLEDGQFQKLFLSLRKVLQLFELVLLEISDAEALQPELPQGHSGSSQYALLSYKLCMTR